MSETLSVRMPAQFMHTVQIAAELNMRSIPKQLQYWAKIGQMAEDNPDLSLDFIKKCLAARKEPSIPFVLEK